MFRSLIILLILSFVSATTITAAQARMADEKTPVSYKIYVEVGYQLGVRSTFREIYGNTIEFGGAVTRSVTERISVGLQGSYLSMESDNLPLTYRNKMIAPFGMAKMGYIFNWDVHFMLGFGLNFRQIEAVGDEVTVTQKDYGTSWIVGFTGERELGSSFLVGMKTQINYITDPEPERGDFGNTGGFSFILRLGYRIR